MRRIAEHDLSKAGGGGGCAVVLARPTRACRDVVDQGKVRPAPGGRA